MGQPGSRLARAVWRRHASARQSLQRLQRARHSRRHRRTRPDGGGGNPRRSGCRHRSLGKYADCCRRKCGRTWPQELQDSVMRCGRVAVCRRQFRRRPMPVWVHVLPRYRCRRQGDGARGKARCARLHRSVEHACQNPWATTVMGTIARHVDISAPPPGSPGLFRCAGKA